MGSSWDSGEGILSSKESKCTVGCPIPLSGQLFRWYSHLMRSTNGHKQWKCTSGMRLAVIAPYQYWEYSAYYSYSHIGVVVRLLPINQFYVISPLITIELPLKPFWLQLSVLLNRATNSSQSYLSTCLPISLGQALCVPPHPPTKTHREPVPYYLPMQWMHTSSQRMPHNAKSQWIYGIIES